MKLEDIDEVVGICEERNRLLGATQEVELAIKEGSHGGGGYQQLHCVDVISCWCPIEVLPEILCILKARSLEMLDKLMALGVDVDKEYTDEAL